MRVLEFSRRAEDLLTHGVRAQVQMGRPSSKQIVHAHLHGAGHCRPLSWAIHCSPQSVLVVERASPVESEPVASQLIPSHPAVACVHTHYCSWGALFVHLIFSAYLLGTAFPHALNFFLVRARVWLRGGAGAAVHRKPPPSAGGRAWAQRPPRPCVGGPSERPPTGAPAGAAPVGGGAHLSGARA